MRAAVSLNFTVTLLSAHIFGIHHREAITPFMPSSCCHPYPLYMWRNELGDKANIMWIEELSGSSSIYILMTCVQFCHNAWLHMDVWGMYIMVNGKRKIYHGNVYHFVCCGRFFWTLLGFCISVQFWHLCQAPKADITLSRSRFPWIQINPPLAT